MENKHINEDMKMFGKTLAELTLEFKHLQEGFNRELDRSEPSLISVVAEPRKEERKKELAKKHKLEEERQNKVLEEFHKKCVEADMNGLYQTGTACGNMAGDRIKRIMHNLNLTIMELADATGVSRSSLQRYLRSKNPDIPKAPTLKKILSNKVFVFGVDLFTRYPDDYKRWEEEYDGGLPVEINGVDKPFTNYEQLKGYIINTLRNPLSYLISKEIPTDLIEDEETGEMKKSQPQYDITEVPMPEEIAHIFATHLLNVFDTIELLLEPEKQKAPSVVISYKTLDETVSFVEEKKGIDPIVVEEFPG